MSLALRTAPSVTAPQAGRFPAHWSVIAGSLEEAANAADADLRPLQAAGTNVSFSRNETIFSEGDSAEYSYKVVSGAVRLCKHMSDGRRQIADFLMPGDFFGLTWTDEYSFTAEAVTDAVVACYRQRQVERLRDEFPGLRNRLLTILCGRLSAAEHHVVLLGRQTAKERVGSFLLMLAGRAGAEDGESVDLPMSRQDIADYLGLTIETVCRVISELKRERIISLSGLHQFVVEDIALLSGMAKGGA